MEVMNQIIGWLIIIGGFASYTFQYVKLCKNKHTDGIDDKMLLLGNFSCILNVLSSIIYNFDNLHHSRGIVIYYTFFPIFELITPLIYIEINYIIYIFYNNINSEKNLFFIYHIVSFIFAIFAILITLAIYIYNLQYINNIIALIFNIISSIASILMWVPQIITTCREKAAKSLSLIGLSCHAIGCFIIVIFQLLEEQPFSIVIPYVIGFLAETLIIVICSYYRIQNEYILRRTLKLNNPMNSDEYISFENL